VGEGGEGVLVLNSNSFPPESRWCVLFRFVPERDVPRDEHCEDGRGRSRSVEVSRGQSNGASCPARSLAVSLGLCLADARAAKLRAAESMREREHQALTQGSKS
jgi:hypothetical protein